MEQSNSLLQEKALVQQAERNLRFSCFSNADALHFVHIVLDTAAQRKTPVVVKVTLAGRTVAMYSCDATSQDNDRWLASKERITQLYGHSSHWMSLELREQGADSVAAWCLDPQTYSASGGCFPIFLHSGLMIGQVSVSGYTPQEDHFAAVHALEQLQLEEESRHAATNS